MFIVEFLQVKEQVYCYEVEVVEVCLVFVELCFQVDLMFGEYLLLLLFVVICEEVQDDEFEVDFVIELNEIQDLVEEVEFELMDELLLQELVFV